MPANELPEAFLRHANEITACRHCARLVAWREQVAQVKRRQYQSEPYWGKPLSGFGDPQARLLVLGLAPAAHGANRTGRMFTGDRSGQWLYRALWKSGFANQPDAVSTDDGLTLRDCWVTAVVRCAPPQNKPTPQEMQACLPYFTREWALLGNIRVVIALGKLAYDTSLRHLALPRPWPVFGHGRAVQGPSGPLLLASYHPSQQNTFTGRLTEPMFDAVFAQAAQALEALPSLQRRKPVAAAKA